MISQSTIIQVVERSNLLDIVQETVSLKRVGKEYVGCCPFHNEKTGSFHVDAAKNMWYCHGACHDGGGVIDYVMKIMNCSFVDAVKELARRCGVAIEEENDKKSAEEIREMQHHESLLIVMSEVQRFYADSFCKSKTKEAEDARAYASRRWGEEFCYKYGIGYADESWDSLIKYADHIGIGITLLDELGLVSYSDKSKSHYDFFRGRIMIPIRDNMQRVIGFTARDISGKKVDGQPMAKYLNSKESSIYKKGRSVFGIDVATRAASREDKFYCVEGAPDVLRLQTVDALNAVAPLGGNWTEEQFRILKKYSQNLCFIPDSDPVKDGEQFGAGVKTVLKYGIVAMNMGFSVSVKEIPFTEHGHKNAPDSYIKCRADLDDLNEKDFVIWYAEKHFAHKTTSEEKSAIVNTISDLIAKVDDSVKESMTIEALAKCTGSKSLWKSAISAAKKRLKDLELSKNGNSVNLDILHKYGFHQNGNTYISIGKDGNEFQWSNFTMRPLFHIKDSVMPVRIYELTNVNKKVEIVELKQEDLVSLTKFKQKVEGLDNYIWLAKEEQLTKLKMYLYESTETAIRIDQLGWQRQGFFAFGNGVFTTEWIPVDDLGIVRLEEYGNFYLPAMSNIYKDDTQFYQFERSFIHTDYNTISLVDYCTKTINVFGDNAKVGISFLLATLFRDVVTSITKSFPILNLFGPKGSGKSELGHTLMSFFIANNTPPNIQNSTVPALADAVAQCSNALLHLDEFKNDIDIIKREFLKGLWDGTGRNRMNMDRDKKREVTKVSCGVIVSGQEMATADIALFSRLIYLSYAKSEFSRKAKEAFEDLRTIRKRGCSHLTLQILKYRKRFEVEFKSNYDMCMSDLIDALADNGIEDRILRNWVIPLAAFRTLEAPLNLPFDYKNLLDISMTGIRKQNNEVKQNNELADFWNFVAYLHQDSKIWHSADFIIKHAHKFKTNLFSSEAEYKEEKSVLILRTKRIFELYCNSGKHGEPRLPKGSLLYYLENSPAYMGVKNSQRFNIMINGQEQTKTETIGNRTSVKKVTTVDRGMCFDYEMIKNTFGISLDYSLVDLNDNT